MTLSAGVFQLLGFAKKANLLVAGDKNVDDAIKKNKVVLLIVAQDVSEKRKGYWQHQATAKQLRWVVFGEKETLGSAIGQSPRGIIAITDKKMANAIEDKMQQ